MNKNIRSLLALAMALAMLLGLTACGQKEEKQAEETPAPEYVYTAAYTPIQGCSDYISGRLFGQDGFYASASEKVGTEIPEGAEVEYEGQYDVYETRLYFVDYNGKMTRLENYAPLPKAENTENYVQFYSGSAVANMALTPEDKLAVVEENYVSCFTGTREEMESDSNSDKWQYSDDFYLRILEKDGTEISCVKLEAPNDNAYMNFNSMAMDEQGNLLASCEMQVLAFSPDGQLAYTIDSPDYINNLVQLKDGRVGYVAYGDNGPQMTLLDLEKHSPGESYAMSNDAWQIIPGSGDYDLYYTNGQNLYGYRLETQESEKVLSWLDVDVDGNSISGVSVREDDSILGVVTDWNSGDTVRSDLVTLSKVPASSVPEKEVLTMAVMNINYDYLLSSAIIKFNRSNDKVRIQVADYSQYNTEDDSSAGLTKLTTEIMAGNMPDLLRLDSALPYKQMAAKGLLEDLYPYLDADKELSREDFFPTVLKAMEGDGKLCQICGNFSIQSLIGASAIVGDTPGWTYAEFDEALSKMPEGCDPMDQFQTRDSILQTLVGLEMDSLVDWSTGKVNFDSQNFIDMLNFAARFPKDFDWDNYEWTEEDEAGVRIQEGRQMLMSGSIYDIDNLFYNDIYFNGETTYIGYPTNSGVGSMIQLGAGDGGLYGMSSNCKDKEAGWQFLRGFLTPEGQKNGWGLPTNKNVFDQKLKEAMTPNYKKDENGNFVLDANGDKIQVSRGQYATSDGQIHNIYAMTQEQADKLLEVINTATRAMSSNDSIYSIVSEQAQAFFAGQKSAEEVARLIQSKANIFVNEQR